MMHQKRKRTSKNGISRHDNFDKEPVVESMKCQEREYQSGDGMNASRSRWNFLSPLPGKNVSKRVCIRSGQFANQGGTVGRVKVTFPSSPMRMKDFY